jgi:hypothetical protein
MSTVVSYKNHSVDLATLPAVSVLALASRGLTRLLGSEVSSKTINEFKGVVDADEAAKEAFAEATRVAFVEALVAGTLGAASPRGPRKDPVESEMELLATREVKETLKKHGLSFTKPEKGAEEKFVPYVAFGNGSRRTMAEMVSKRISEHSDRLRKAAEKAIADAKRLADKAAEGLGEAEVTAEALGL